MIKSKKAYICRDKIQKKTFIETHKKIIYLQELKNNHIHNWFFAWKFPF